MKIPPIINMIFGFILCFGAFNYDPGNKVIDTILAVLGILGMVIFINGMRLLRKQAGKT